MIRISSLCPDTLNARSPTLGHVYWLGKGLEEVTLHVRDNVSLINMLQSECLSNQNVLVCMSFELSLLVFLRQMKRYFSRINDGTDVQAD